MNSPVQNFRKKAAKPGGTTLETSRTRLPIVIVAIAVAAGLGVFLRSSAKDDKPAETVEVVSGEPATEGGAEDFGDDVPEDTSGAPSPIISDGEGRSRLAMNLEAELSDLRLWTTVELSVIEPSLLVLRTAHCEEEKLKAALTDNQASLAQEKFTRVECYARHGKLIFELNI